MKYKVAELEVELLDLAVAAALQMIPIPGEPPGFFYRGRESGWFAPSSDVLHAWPVLVAKKRMPEWSESDGGFWWSMDSHGRIHTSDQPLVAPLRAIVASHFGEEVEL